MSIFHQKKVRKIAKMPANSIDYCSEVVFKRDCFYLRCCDTWNECVHSYVETKIHGTALAAKYCKNFLDFVGNYLIEKYKLT